MFQWQHRQINMSLSRLVSNLHFCNKMWQATRFVVRHATAAATLPDYAFIPLASADFPTLNRSSQMSTLDVADRWILTRLSQSIKIIRTCFSQYHFGDAVVAFQQFFLADFCDVYLEFVKTGLYSSESSTVTYDVYGASVLYQSFFLYLQERKTAILNVLYSCLDMSFRLAHPMMPFLTEELWSNIPSWPGKPAYLMLARMPSSDLFEQFEDTAATLQMNVE